ncbi:MAG: Gfo/Idh/MocA family oxidoreductase [Candidatus Hydrogenedentes bacterium]|nr:Gfo/Idh/MocA family oxidoreductase [Candidatus Hydrogenedentota bacterium]
MKESSMSMQASPSRREFIRTSSAALAAATAVAGARPLKGAYAQETSQTLRVGLIGCGGRGSGAIRQALLADPNTKLVAMGDAFADRLDASLKQLQGSDLAARVQVEDDHKFTGFDAHKQVIEASDVVLLAEPPAFRPASLRAAIEAGKHVFCEKPIAVDPVGVRQVMETCEMAQGKGLNIVSGLCYRYEFSKQDTMKRIHDGELGDILVIQTTYNTGGLWHRGSDPNWSEMEYQVRNWLYFDWLSGDHINEQHIHSLDKVAWAMGDAYPVKCTSSGGRVQRTDPKYGNIYDHFNTVYEWANGVKAFSSCRQWESSSTDVSDHVIGTKGVAHIQDHAIDSRDGRTWKHEKQENDDMYQNEHNALFAAIRKGEPINNGNYMCKSTLMAIMARMAAYTGKTVTWDEIQNSDLNLAPAKLEWGPHPVNPVAVPGSLEKA